MNIEYQDADKRSSVFNAVVKKKIDGNTDKLHEQSIRMFEDIESIFGHSLEILKYVYKGIVINDTINGTTQ